MLKILILRLHFRKMEVL